MTDLADKYLLAEEILTAAGYAWYRVSNWARSPAARCRHNLGYWRGDDWWGIGPGPTVTSEEPAGGTSSIRLRTPAGSHRASRPGMPARCCHRSARRTVLLELRLSDGLERSVLTASEQARIPAVVGGGLVDQTTGRITLTIQGRLLADGVIRDLLD
jgi:oxygen-independent coproporphyrinogen-3 oxidase